MKKVLILVAAVLAAAVFAEELTIVPGFKVCSIEHEGGSSGKIKFRKSGTQEWKNAHDFIFVEQEKVLRSSLLELEEDTSYELEAVVEGKKYIRKFKTRNCNFPVAETIYLTKKDCGRTFKPKSGTASGYIRYTAEPGFVFQCGKKSGIGILIEKGQYIILDGLTIRGGRFNAIRIRDSKHIAVVNCDISGYGQGGVFRPDLDGKYYNEKNKAIWHDAGINIRGCDDVLIERNFIHDPKTPGNSWFYSHPAGSDGIMIGNTKRAVIRYNDIIGSDKFRWNDAIAGDCDNFSLIGGPSEDAEIYGNYFAFGNDDSVELDGGQKNSRFFFNRIEGFFCGVSVAAVRRGPSFIYCNDISRPGDEFGLRGVALKTLCGRNVTWGKAFFYGNKAEGRAMGYPRIAGNYTSPRFTCRGNIYPAADGSMYEEFKEKNYTVDTDDKLAVPAGVPEFPAVLPVRTGLLTQDKTTVEFIQPQKMDAQTVTVTYHGKKTAAYKIRKCDAAWHFTVFPEKGTVNPGESVILTVTPNAGKTARLNCGAFIFRLADGCSVPVSVYVNALDDSKLVQKAMQSMIKGKIEKNGTTHTMIFDLPKDGNYILFVRKGADCANRVDMKLPGKAPVFRRMKLRDKRHEWEVPADSKDSNAPLVLKKGRCEIVIQKSKNSSKTPDITHAYLCSDWHSVLPLVDKFDKLLLE